MKTAASDRNMTRVLGRKEGNGMTSAKLEAVRERMIMMKVIYFDQKI